VFLGFESAEFAPSRLIVARVPNIEIMIVPFNKSMQSEKVPYSTIPVIIQSDGRLNGRAVAMWELERFSMRQEPDHPLSAVLPALSDSRCTSSDICWWISEYRPYVPLPFARATGNHSAAFVASVLRKVNCIGYSDLSFLSRMIEFIQFVLQKEVQSPPAELFGPLFIGFCLHGADLSSRLFGLGTDFFEAVFSTGQRPIQFLKSDFLSTLVPVFLQFRDRVALDPTAFSGDVPGRRDRCRQTDRLFSTTRRDHGRKGDRGDLSGDRINPHGYIFSESFNATSRLHSII
jgi:hypothetical protein